MEDFVNGKDFLDWRLRLRTNAMFAETVSVILFCLSSNGTANPVFIQV
jgi:hypothetical protein